MSVQDGKVPLASTLNERNFAGSVNLRLLNRFYEQDPVDQDTFSLVARYGTRQVTSIGPGPFIRATYAQDGVFGGDLFVVSGDGLYRYNGSTITPISGLVAFNAQFPSITAQVSPGIERIWIADGDRLSYYEGVSRSQAALVLDSGNAVDGDIVVIGGVYYRFTTTGLDTGAPAGTVSNPWRVLIGSNAMGSLQNLGNAIDASGITGGQYSTATVPHPLVTVRRVQAMQLDIQARTAGTDGNSIAVSETSTAFTWRNSAGAVVTALSNGGVHALIQVALPDGSNDSNRARALAVTSISGFVVVASQDQQRLYFIFPGEFWSDTFAGAEAEPDQLIDVKAVADTLWVFGSSTIEIWNATGQEKTPFAPVIGRSLRYGAVSNTIAVIDNDIYYVDTTGIARNGSGERISTHTIEEKIRLRG